MNREDGSAGVLISFYFCQLDTTSHHKKEEPQMRKCFTFVKQVKTSAAKPANQSFISETNFQNCSLISTHALWHNSTQHGHLCIYKQIN